jgi:hypothetical protein
LLPSVWNGQAANEAACVDIQPVCDSHEGFKAEAALTTFDFPELCPMNPTARCRGLLAQAQL